MFLSDVAKELGSVLQSPEFTPLFSGEGSLRFKQKNNNKEAKLYIKKGEIYAIQVSGVRMEILRRVVTSEYIDPEVGKRMLAAFRNDLADPEIIDFINKEKLIPSRVVDSYLKDLLLGSGDELFTWKNVDVDWLQDDESEGLISPKVEISKFFSILMNRDKAFKDFAHTFTVNANDLNKLTFKKNGKPKAYDQTDANILELGNGEWSLFDLSQTFSISFFSICHLITKLWSQGAITVMYAGYPIYSPGYNADKVERMEKGILPSIDVAPLSKSVSAKTETIANNQPAYKPQSSENVLRGKNQYIAEIKHRIAVNERIAERAMKACAKDKAELSILEEEYRNLEQSYKQGDN